MGSERLAQAQEPRGGFSNWLGVLEAIEPHSSCSLPDSPQALPASVSLMQPLTSEGFLSLPGHCKEIFVSAVVLLSLFQLWRFESRPEKNNFGIVNDEKLVDMCSGNPVTPHGLG